eukprot:721357-Alexandrium_andersonii.AAC.1
MSASLVGSEMCIRDRTRAALSSALQYQAAPGGFIQSWAVASAARQRAVSYTHLTLPTICSV